MEILVTKLYYDVLNCDTRYILLRGSTRCLEPTTEIRMANGSLKQIKDIKIGDKVSTLIGSDEVVDTHSGRCDMYEISQGKGQPYIVTEDHLLSVKQTRKNRHKENYKIIYDNNYDKELIYDFTAKEFSEFSENKRKKYSGFKDTFLQLKKKNNKIDPYYLGLWIGDGTSRKPYQITTADEEIVEYLNQICPDECKIEFDNRYTYSMRHKLFNRQSQLSKSFYDENLVNNKHIPKQYIYTCYQDRLKLLAGLVDSDGYNTGRNTLSITQKRKNIIVEIEEILKISGFYTNGIVESYSTMKRKDGSIYKCKVYSIEFNHKDFQDLNRYIKIDKKRVYKNLDSRSDNYMFTTNIKSKHIGIGDYCGFTLKTCPYFRLKDGTITHNSSKTVSIIQYLLTEMMQTNNLKIVIGVETLASSKSGLILDIEKWIHKFGLVDDINVNQSTHTYKLTTTNSKLIIIPADKPSKWFGLEADIFWFNEATHIQKEIFEQAQMRLPDRKDYRCKFILDFNPTNPFSWVRELENSNPPGGLTTFVSTYKDNPFLGKDQVALIESWKDTNYNKWLVYGQGEYGEVQGSIFKNWKVVDSFPDVSYTLGLDWGFTNDPTAIIKVGIYNSELYVQQVMYERGQTNSDIIHFLRDNNLADCEIIADSAEPKSIEEFKRGKIRKIFPCKKGPDSILNGIDIMMRYKINIVKPSQALIDEFTNYIWKKDKIKGEFTNVPSDGWNHGIDSIRYVCLNKFGTKSNGPGIIFRRV
jgi:phage terminase large subunit